MGSMESLSSHSSEQNSCSKTGSPSRAKHKPSGSLCWTTPSSNGPKRSAYTTSPDSSSKEDANKTDGEWEEALSTSPGDRGSPISELLQRPLGEQVEGHGEERRSLSTASSLTSLHISEGKNVDIMFVLGGFPSCFMMLFMFMIRSCGESQVSGAVTVPFRVLCHVVTGTVSSLSICRIFLLKKTWDAELTPLPAMATRDLDLCKQKDFKIQKWTA